MKIKVKTLPYEEVCRLPRAEHKKPRRPSLFFRTLVRTVASGDLKDAGFTYTVDQAVKNEKGPFLILMNHSCFLDLEIVSKIFYPKPYCIVCTSDGFVGKPWLMRQLGCIPTQKFVTDLTLIRDMKTALRDQKTSVLLYPEASYSFDGCATPLPDTVARLLKMLGVPVLMIKTEGAFAYDPLYNGLQKRKVKVSAHVSLLASGDEIKDVSTEELKRRLDEAFTFDAFAWQKEKRVEIREPFRADHLERVLYRCPACLSEGKTEGKGTTLTCHACHKTWELDSFGVLHGQDGKTEFSHIPDWYAWERACVREALENGTYRLDTDVDIAMMVDYKVIYRVGSGRLIHDRDGFSLTGCGGALSYHQKPLASYGLYADYFWYELGDVICIGDADALYYCFPKQEGVVAKTRLAAEELYRIVRAGKRTKSE